MESMSLAQKIRSGDQLKQCPGSFEGLIIMKLVGSSECNHENWLKQSKSLFVLKFVFPEVRCMERSMTQIPATCASLTSTTCVALDKRG